MSEAVPSEKNEKLPQEEFEGHISENFGGVILDEKGQAYAVTRDGEGIVAVPNDMGRMIALALRTQDKVDSGKYPRLKQRFAALNCRKTVFAVTEAATLSEATDDQQEDIDGLEHLFSDVERIQDAGYPPFLFTEADEKVTEALHEYTGTFPCVVHLFEFDNGSLVAEAVEQNMRDQGGFLDTGTVEKMHRMHSFLVLGEDFVDEEDGSESIRYVCFQKTESGLRGMIMVSDLDMALAHELSPNRTGVAFIGPAR